MSRLEVESDRERERLNSDIRTLTDKLKAYEALEVEVDQAVMRIAAKNRDVMHPELTDIHDIRGIPSNPESRVRQAVFLAQKLLQTERQRDEALQQVQTVEGELQKEKAGRLSAEDRLHMAAQPAVYLVNKLREEETLRVQLADRVTVLSKEVQKWKLAWQKDEKEIVQLRERLQLVLRQRGELETIKVMLHHLHYLQEHGSDDESSEDEVEDNDTDDLARKLLPWRPGADDGEIEFEMSSAGEPERNAVAEALGLPGDTMNQLLARHSPSSNASSTRRQQYQERGHPDESRLYTGEADVSRIGEDDDPEIIPMAYVRPDAQDS